MIFLLLALPLQMSWAGVAPYCSHESGAAARHFGHHEHQHQAKKADSAKGASTLTADNDCVTCHLGGIGVLPMAFSSMPSEPPQAERLGARIALLPCLLPDRPERPKWVRAV